MKTLSNVWYQSLRLIVEFEIHSFGNSSIYGILDENLHGEQMEFAQSLHNSCCSLFYRKKRSKSVISPRTTKYCKYAIV